MFCSQFLFLSNRASLEGGFIPFLFVHFVFIIHDSAAFCSSVYSNGCGKSAKDCILTIKKYYAIQDEQKASLKNGYRAIFSATGTTEPGKAWCHLQCFHLNFGLCADQLLIIAMLIEKNIFFFLFSCEYDCSSMDKILEALLYGSSSWINYWNFQPWKP